MADIAASVLTRLKNKAQASGRSCQLCLQLFCQEEFLRRLEKSKYAENFVLKGGLFIYSLTEFDSRVTGIKYSDFEDAMTKYMTTDVLKNEFSEFINYNGVLYMKDVTGKQSDYMINQITEKSIKGNETTYEIEKQNMNNFITLKQNITLKYANGTCVVSNVES